jgi:hypothetical protein
MAEQENSNTQQTAGTQQPSVQQQQRQARPCPKDCSKCSFQQHAYCAARMAFQMFEVMNGVIQRLDIQSERIAEMEQRLAAIGQAGAELISPLPVEGDLFPAEQ